MTCKIEGCEKKKKARGWCNKHWQRWWRNGDPEKGKWDEDKSPIQNVLERYIPEPNTGCWIWEGSTDGTGYPNVWNGGSKGLVHRMIWQYYYGEIPEGYVIAHNCSNKLCINPNHLYCCTQRQNMQDYHWRGI